MRCWAIALLAAAGAVLSSPALAQTQASRTFEEEFRNPTAADTEVTIMAGRTGVIGGTQVGDRQRGSFGTEPGNPYDRVDNRLQNRVQNRIRNRIDEHYRPDANAASPFDVAGSAPESSRKRTR